MVTIIDEEDHKLLERSLPNKLEASLDALAPYQKDITGIAVESTYNWYWLVDGLMEAEKPGQRTIFSNISNNCSLTRMALS